MAINGFSTCNATARGRAFRVPGTKRSLQVRAEVAPLLIGLAAEFHRLVSPIDAGRLDDWGYACRDVRGRNSTSFHAAGIAIDLQALKFPLGRRNMTARQRATCRALARKYGCRWGGDFGRPDEMHFEVILPRSQALALVRRVQGAPATKAAPKLAAPRQSKLIYGAKNSDVVLLQQRLIKLGYSVGGADGIYGPKTRSAVQSFQRRQGWSAGAADGRIGPVTLDRLF
jgi:hypothetical protein